jgi:hypothetical protein
MRRRWVRFLTALVVVSISALAVYRGSDIVRFGLADAGLGPDGKAAEVDRPWVNVPGLAFSAQESLLKGEGDPDDQKATNRRREELKNILAVRPLSAKYWLALAEMHSVTGERASTVVEAVRLSVLSGPNEHDLMVGREIFAVSHWEILPLELRQRTGADLAADTLAETEIADLRLALAKKSEKIRNEILAVLQTERVPAKDLVAIGF